MFSMSKSTGRLMWALSMLGFDRLMRMMGAGPSWEHHGHQAGDNPESETRVLDDLADRLRGLMSPGISSMFEAGERIIERFFGMGQDSWPEPWHGEGLHDSHWPFPTTPVEHPDPTSHHGADIHPLSSHPTAPRVTEMDHLGHDFAPPVVPHPSTQPEESQDSSSHSSGSHLSAPTQLAGSDPQTEADIEDWTPLPKIPDIATYFETGSQPSPKTSSAERPHRVASGPQTEPET